MSAKPSSAGGRTSSDAAAAALAESREIQRVTSLQRDVAQRERLKRLARRSPDVAQLIRDAAAVLKRVDQLDQRVAELERENARLSATSPKG